MHDDKTNTKEKFPFSLKLFLGLGLVGLVLLPYAYGSDLFRMLFFIVIILSGPLPYIVDPYDPFEKYMLFLYGVAIFCPLLFVVFLKMKKPNRILIIIPIIVWFLCSAVMLILSSLHMI